MARIKCPKCLTVNPDGQEKCVQCGSPMPRIRISARPGPTPAPKHSPAGDAAAQGDLMPGQTLANRYTILGLVGRGGMGCIYKVRDNTLGEEVALKTLLPKFVRDKLVVERFFNEAKIARRMAHPNIVRVHDIGNAQGTVYISMEFVDGRSLRNMMEALRPGERLPVLTVLKVIEELCESLEYAHQFTVHRDIKPENIMIDAAGRVKLMDFGISKLMANTRMTGASVVMGTPFYMSPEQLRNSRDVDARADIFSVGVVLYETLTGNVPTGVPKAPSEVVPDLPTTLDQIVGRCVEPDPARRFQDAGELRRALKGVIQSLSAPDDIETGPPEKRPRRQAGGSSIPWGGIAATVACLIATGAAVFGAEAMRSPDDGAGRGASGGTSAMSDVDRLEAVMLRARDAASSIADPNSDQTAILASGEEWLATANDTPDSQADAKRQRMTYAMQSFLAALLQPSLRDMVFIPGGTVRGDADAQRTGPFFIDRYEVSEGAFAEFCRENSWRQPCGDTSGDFAELPAARLTWYDAQAYAAAQDKRLPTSAQWLRAARGDRDTDYANSWEGAYDPESCHCETGAPQPVAEAASDLNWAGVSNLVGNVREWTRTSASGDAPGFGVPMVVRGGDYQSGPATFDTTMSEDYGGFADFIGLRCVKELPESASAAEALLADLS